MRNSKNNGTLKLGCNMNPSTLHFHQHGKPLLESKIPEWTKSHTDRKKSFWNCSQRLDAKGLWHINLRWHDCYQITMSMAWTRNWFRCERIEKNICESVSLYQSHEILWLKGRLSLGQVVTNKDLCIWGLLDSPACSFCVYWKYLTPVYRLLVFHPTNRMVWRYLSRKQCWN